MNQTHPHANFRWHSPVQPKPKSIETPCCGPTDQWPKQEPVDQPARCAENASDNESTLEIELRWAVGNHIANIPNPLQLVISDPSQTRTLSRRSHPGSVLARSTTFAFPVDPQSETNARRIAESLRLVFQRFREVVDGSEAQIPEFMQIGSLSAAPDFIRAGADENLYVNSGIICHEKKITCEARVILMVEFARVRSLSSSGSSQCASYRESSGSRFVPKPTSGCEGRPRSFWNGIGRKAW